MSRVPGQNLSHSSFSLEMEDFIIQYANGYQDAYALPLEDPVTKYLHRHLSEVSNASSISHHHFVTLLSDVKKELGQSVSEDDISTSITEVLSDPFRITICFGKLEGRYGEVMKKGNGTANLILNTSYYDYLAKQFDPSIEQLEHVHSSQPKDAAVLSFITQRSFTWLHLPMTFLHELSHAFIHLLFQASTPRKLNSICRSGEVQGLSDYHLEELALRGDLGALFSQGLEGNWAAVEGLAVRKADGWHLLDASDRTLSDLNALRISAPNFSHAAVDYLLDPCTHSGIFSSVHRNIKVTHVGGGDGGSHGRFQIEKESEKHKRWQAVEDLLSRTTLVSDKC